ncbi:baseplate multidomain protein megatron [Salipiger mangrovisoli]|uniref:Glycoside hydrolase/phage tail family protein n=1 Tax=Salipiger mangrovisoli TaxID=2865933 RepID=A0ABR9WWR6_9RHOB|nr:glycoside hydrolase/phage tail family protein [Salipiger mangrovisoli]MBE9635716.1 glycoside hydrolase/phage tail family protein [Salipiger mangrovisoli]
MATILLSAAGAALGSSVGGSVLGLSMTAVGRFIGAGLGRALDQRLLGAGSETVETGRIERFRLAGSGEGAAVPHVWGRMRVGAQVIWATEFTEHMRKSKVSSGGKGSPRSETTVKSYSYSLSLALALCEGEITGVGRVWADGAEIAPRDLNMRVYTGCREQLPDPKIEAVEGAGNAPAYRGTAYVVIEDLMLERFGNRVPQFSFEVTRPELGDAEDVPRALRGVAMIPGTGEYALATQPVYLEYGGGARGAVNLNTPAEVPDFLVSLNQLRDELPECRAASLVVSWFGSDLRCGTCSIRPKVEQSEWDSAQMPWRVSGLGRDGAELVPQQGGRPVYGGTPADVSVIEALQEMAARGLDVVFYPFVLMDQMAGNTLTDPWTGAEGQPALPWRGRITTSLAPGQSGSPDGSAVADAEVSAFFGTATAADFSVAPGAVVYAGPEEWSFRRFILHQAALCAAAGGVTAFCIGSEMRALTQIRGASGFPAVAGLRALAAECRALLGPEVKIGYAADWSEYFGFHPQDGTGDVYFHLDPLWSDAQIDFIGIDNYMPLADWRDGDDHADAHWGAIYSPDYLKANIEGGEGFDWYYPSPEARAAQRRAPITDGAHGEDWVYRYKDLRSWWSRLHHERIAGVRQDVPTGWQPQSKPIWFTELGCAAIDKGANQPNKFLDPKSSESKLPHYSNGLRDELMQRQYLRAVHSYWNDAAHNPVSEVYGAQMLDMSRALVWAWDARPYPWFPGLGELWSDGANYRRGHWLNGRASARTLASVVAEICVEAGLTGVDVSQAWGWVRGYHLDRMGDARAALQPLLLAHGVDAVERDGMLRFVQRRGRAPVRLDPAELVHDLREEADLLHIRAAEAEMAGRLRLRFVEADGDHGITGEEVVLPDTKSQGVAETELAMALTRAEGRMVLERWLAEARIARDTLRFALPLSQMALGAGDIVELPAASGPLRARIDRVESGSHRKIEAVRIEPDTYLPADMDEGEPLLRPFAAPVPVEPLFLDLPLLHGSEMDHAPHLAVTASPWPGSVAVYDAASDADYLLNDIIAARATVGVTETPLAAAPAGRIDRGAPLQIVLRSGALQSVSEDALLGGANVLAISDGAPGNWELLQFRDAELLAPGRWLVSHRLRGQAGSDGLMPEAWPAGSWVVLLDGAPQQIALAPSQRRQARHYRIGPARRGYDDPSYVHRVLAFDGNGLRPYRPAHLRAAPASGSALRLSWIRRTRIDGDDWELPDVPLAEESERYLMRVLQGGAVLREAFCTEPQLVYDPAQDSLSGAFEVQVAQVSARYGAGPFARLTLFA